MKSVLTIFASLGLVVGLNLVTPTSTALAFPASVPLNNASNPLLSPDRATNDVQQVRWRRRGRRHFRRHHFRSRHRHVRRHRFRHRLRHVIRRRHFSHRRHFTHRRRHRSRRFH